MDAGAAPAAPPASLLLGLATPASHALFASPPAAAASPSFLLLPAECSSFPPCLPRLGAAFPSAKRRQVAPFGSFVSGVSLPGADLDVVVSGVMTPISRGGGRSNPGPAAASAAGGGAAAGHRLCWACLAYCCTLRCSPAPCLGAGLLKCSCCCCRPAPQGSRASSASCWRPCSSGSAASCRWGSGWPASPRLMLCRGWCRCPACRGAPPAARRASS